MAENDQDPKPKEEAPRHVALADMVLYRNPETHDGEHPAIVTKVHDASLVNLTVFLDGEAPTCRAEVPFNDSEPEAAGWRF